METEMKQHKRKSYRSYLSLLVCSYLTVCGGGTTVSFAADMSETQEAQSAQESASATAPIKLSDSYGNTDKFLCCATLPRKITIEKDNKR